MSATASNHEVTKDQRPQAGPNGSEDSASGECGDLTIDTEVKALREGERRSRLALQAAQAVGFEWDLANGHLFRSENVCGILGYERDEIEPTVEWGRKLIHPDDLPGHLARLQEFIESDREVHHQELRIKHKNGAYRWFRIHALKEPGRNGAIRRVFGCYVDVTEQKLAQIEHQQLEKQLMQTQKLESLGVLAGGIAHDFNNLLTVIAGNLALVRGDLTRNDPHQQLLIEAENAAQFAAELCRQMLAYAGGGKLQNRPLDLTELVESSRVLVVSVAARQAKMVFHLARGLPAIAGDPSQIRQVLLNLVQNAAEALPESGGKIEVSTGSVVLDESSLEQCLFRDELANQHCVWLEVRDNGQGFEPHIQRRMFEPFFSTKFTGRGLGLAVVLGVVRGHRGAILAQSRPGRQTTFRVYFPACPEPLGRDGQSRTTDPHATSTPKPVRAHGTVLVADDEPSVRAVLSRLLARQGFSVIEAQDGEEALEMLKHHADSLRLLVIDVTMPRRDGISALRELRRLGYDIPVVVVSGFFAADLAPQLDELNASYLPKPFQAADLWNTLSRALSASSPSVQA
jgi:PAS domain S-box-containing protein